MAQTYYASSSNLVKQLIAVEIQETEDNFELDLDDWKTVSPDRAHTCGRTSQYKNIVHLFWMMKSILPEALEQFPPNMHLASHGHPDYIKEFQKI